MNHRSTYEIIRDRRTKGGPPMDREMLTYSIEKRDELTATWTVLDELRAYNDEEALQMCAQKLRADFGDSPGAYRIAIVTARLLLATGAVIISGSLTGDPPRDL